MTAARTVSRPWVAIVLVALSVGGGFAAAWLVSVPATGGAAPHAAALSSAHPGLTPAGAGGSAFPTERPSRSLEAGSSPHRPLATGLPSSEIFVPNPTRSHIDSRANVVRPSLQSVPAPMGVSDLGVNKTGAYTYRTSSFEGTVTIRSLSALQPGYVGAPPYDAPDWALLELNAVAVNVSFANAAPPGEFWVQNAVHLNRTTLQFEDNIWNFSAPNGSVLPNIISGHAGQTYRNQFYAGFGPQVRFAFPITVTLYDNISRVGTHDEVFFNYTLIPSSGPSSSGTYDFAVFNGTASPLSPPQFQVNGSALTPSGQLYDAELVLGGNGGGTNTNVLALNATANLRAYNRTAAAYRPIRAAYDYGPDSAETSQGIAVHYTTNGSTAYLTTGPSFMYGLWNTSGAFLGPAASPGSIHVQLTTTPNYALLVANLSAWGGGYSYAPSTAAGIMNAYLPPLLNGTPYVFDAYADGFLPSSATVNASVVTYTQAIALVSSPTTWNAPLYLNGEAQLLAFSNATAAGAAYSVAADTLWVNATKVTLAAPFRALNILANPTFQLFVEESLSTGVQLTGLVQDPMTFNYTYYQAPTRFYPGWTQGYYFFGGSGRFSVDATTLSAVPGLLNQPTPTFPAPTIEFYFTNRSSAHALTVSNDALGVSAFGARSLTVSSVTVATGGQGVVASNLSGLAVTGVAAAGLDLYLHPSVGLVLQHVSSAHLAGVAASGFGVGFESSNSTNLTIVGVNVATAAVGFETNTTDASNISWVNVTGGISSAAGNWSNSVNVNFSHLAIAGTGLVMQHDSAVSVLNASATGPGAGVVQELSNSTSATFALIFAGAGSVGVNVSNTSHVTITNLTATLSSTGASITDCSNVTGTQLASSVASTGIAWVGGSHGRFNLVSTSVGSIGLWIQNVTYLVLGNITAINLTLGSAYYFVDNATFRYNPIAAVGLLNDSVVNVTNVQATGYPFGVWSNGTKSLTLSTVEGWYDGILVDLNATSTSRVQQVFAFSSQFGLFLKNSTYVTVTTSTFEQCGVLGLEVENGSHNTITLNNFVGNNGSSVSGVYSSSHVQAWTNNTTLVSFSQNFWADHMGSSAYTVNNSIRDAKPQAQFYSYYLEFTESGLVPGQSWYLDVGTDPIYNLTTSELYIPGWSIPSGTLTFVVIGPLLPAPHPPGGNITWFGTTLPAVNIVFGTPPTPLLILGLPVWAFAVVIVLAAAIALFVLFRWARRRRPPRVREPFDAEFP